MTTRRWRILGIGLAVAAMLGLGSLDLAQHYHPGRVAFLLTGVRVVPLLIYRARPVAAWWLALGASVGTALVTTPVSPSEPWPWAVTTIAMLASMTGVVAARGNRPHSAAFVGLVGVLGAGLVLIFPGRGDWESVLTGLVLCFVAAILGDTVHVRRRAVTELAEEREVSEAERARRSLVEERARIARELHDVVAHHMSMITVQAETARYRLAGLPDPVVDEFTGIARLARGSLTELRGLLTALRDERDAPVLAPQPTLANVRDLVDRVTAAGTPVRLTVTGGLDELPQVVQLSAYRVVQEALSNVARHAGGAPAEVEITAGERLRVSVTNARPPVPAVPGGRAGHGLVGLRERATLLGGTFEVDQPDGGWRVRVTLPVRPAGEGS